MNLVKETLKVVLHEANKKANEATKMKQQQPEKAEFWQGQYQAFSEMYTMIDQMIKVK